MRLGFTGTRDGTTCEQHKALCEWIKANAQDMTEFHHGCCIGADAEGWEAVTTFAKPVVHAHPSDLRRMTSPSALGLADVKHPRKPPLDRNRDIVDACDVLVACPKSEVEQFKGGTWYTVRQARKVGRRVVIVWPNGTVEG